jgi:hypothetical protein
VTYAFAVTRSERRSWVLPVVFALAVVWMPVQTYVVARHSEPWPALLQPEFGGDGQDDGFIELLAVEIEVDGRAIQAHDLFPADGPPRDIVRGLFPPRGDEARVPDRTRQALRAAATRAIGAEPRELTVAWERRRYDLETGTFVRRSPLARYRMDLAP